MDHRAANFIYTNWVSPISHSIGVFHSWLKTHLFSKLFCP